MANMCACATCSLKVAGFNTLFTLISGRDVYEPATFMAKNRGTILLDKEGASFFKQNFCQDKVRWRCTRYRKECKAKLITRADLIICRFNYHNHPIP